MTRHLELLSQIGIEPLALPGQERHLFFVREQYAALVERTREGGLGRVGTAGRMTERGLAMLMWRDGQAYFVAKGAADEPATDAEVAALRSFTSDLERILRSC